MRNNIDSIGIIIGSMKSGTSSLYNYLIQHPEICPSRIKEPEFFTENQGHGLKVDNYYDLWDFDSLKHKVVLEASTGYTKYPFEQNVPRKIFDYGINPKFIYIVRNPLDRILSQHLFLKNKGKWGDLPVISDQTILLSKYFLQLQNFRLFFSKENFLILDFDELVNNPQISANKVFAFLDIAQYKIDANRIYNETKTSNNTIQFLKSRFSRIIRVLPSSFNKKSHRLITTISKPKKRKLSQKEIFQIRKMLVSDMREFSSEYNFDIKKWGF